MSECTTCHATLADEGAFHPHEFCLLRRLGLSDRDIAAFVRKASGFLNPDGTWRLVREGPRTDEALLQEMREWLGTHSDTPPRECVLCSEPVAKDTVIAHLLEQHDPFQVALLVALWWFLTEDEEDPVAD